MINLAIFINSLPPVDIVFFIICAAAIVITVGIYFLIPVFNKKQYQEQRDNLRKREEAFRTNKDYIESIKQDEDNTPETTKVESTSEAESK